MPFLSVLFSASMVYFMVYHGFGPYVLPISFLILLPLVFLLVPGADLAYLLRIGVVSLIVLQLTAGWWFFPLSGWSAHIIVPFVPLAGFAFRNELKKRDNRFLIVPLVLFLSGAMLSWGYQLLFQQEPMPFSQSYDRTLVLGFSLYVFFYFLLVGGVLTVQTTLFSLIVSGVLYLVYLFGVHSVGAGRLGSQAGISPNLLAGFLDLLFPISFFLALASKSLWAKMFLFASSFLFLIGVLATGSRGSVFGLAVFSVYFVYRSWDNKKVLIPALSLGSIVAFVFGKIVIERLFTADVSTFASNFGRLELIRAAFEILKDRYYLFGVGMDNFKTLKFEYGFPTWFDQKGSMSSHNLYLEFWLGWGILGLLAWLSLLWGNIVLLIRKRVTARNRHVRDGILLSLISFALHGLVDSFVANFLTMFILFALLACAGYMISEPKAELAS